MTTFLRLKVTFTRYSIATSVEEEGEWNRLIFAETTGTVTRDREKMVIS